MQTIKKATKRRSRSQQDRKNSRRSGSNNAAHRGEQVGVDSGSFHIAGFPVLTKQLRTMYQLDTMVATKSNEYLNIVSIVDTKEKQLQAIEDLWSIVKAQPRYKNLNDDKWNENTEPLEVLGWILRKLGPLAEGKFWYIDTYNDKGKARYQLIIQQPYSGYHLKHQAVYFPLEFLPALKLKDEHLHDLIIDVVALVSGNNKIPLWDEDGDYSSALQYWMVDKVTHGNPLIDEQLKMYDAGLASEYLARIKARRKTVKTADFYDRPIGGDFKKISERRFEARNWINKGIEVAKYKQCITRNSYVPNYIGGNPVSPYRKLKFVWSAHEHDILNARAWGQIQKDKERYGYQHWPISFTVTKPGERVKKMTHDEFPIDLWDFMVTGYSHFVNRYESYYYGNLLRDPQRTPGPTLLESVLFHDIKTLAK